MNERKQKDDEFLYLLLQKKKVNASKETREKSLLAFRDGLNDETQLPKLDQKRRKLRQQIIGSTTAAVAAGIAGILFLNTGILESDRSEEKGNVLISEGEKSRDDGNVEVSKGVNEDVEYNEKTTEVQTVEEQLSPLERVLNRPSFDYDDLNAMPSKRIFDDKLVVHLPEDWTIYEKDGDQDYSIYMVGSEGEKMSLLLLNQGYSQEEFEAHLEELTAGFVDAEEVTISANEFVDKIRGNHDLTFPYPNVFPFEIEEAKISAYIDEENNQFMELYISELFGHPMIFTAEFSLENAESWKLPISFFTHMRVGVTPYVVHGSAGELHPEYKRPVDKSVILQVGASGVEQIDVELYENHELGLTSYLPRNTEVNRIDHDLFTEWRFTESGVSANSFYSFGKLKNGFPLDKGKEVMFEAFDIDLSYHEDLGGPIPHHYSYYSGMDGDFFDGFFELFEVSGEWYYKHKHADRNDYNGGVYIQRLDMFMNSMEWN